MKEKKDKCVQTLQQRLKIYLYAVIFSVEFLYKTLKKQCLVTCRSVLQLSDYMSKRIQ